MTDRLRWGFKTEANEIARQVRSELGLTSTSPLDPRRLANHLEVPVWGFAAISEQCPEAIRYFSGPGASEFSAVTVFHGPTRVIVHNDTHVSGRQASNLAHELAHALLLHPPTPPLTELRLRTIDRALEAEADWLGGALLLPDEATLWIARRGLADEVAAEHFGVSLPMLRFRMNVCGARRRVERAGHSTGRPSN